MDPSPLLSHAHLVSITSPCGTHHIQLSPSLLFPYLLSALPTIVWDIVYLPHPFLQTPIASHSVLPTADFQVFSCWMGINKNVKAFMRMVSNGCRQSNKTLLNPNCSYLYSSTWGKKKCHGHMFKIKILQKRFRANKPPELINSNSENMSSSIIWGHLFQSIEEKKWKWTLPFNRHFKIVSVNVHIKLWSKSYSHFPDEDFDVRIKELI